MTSECRGRSRRLNGSIVTRRVSNRCVTPDPSVTGPSRRTSASYARGQSFSVPSSSPMMCSTVSSRSTQARQVVRELGPPPGPVVRDVVAPQAQLAPDAFVSEQAGHLLRRVQRAGGVLPLALAADQQRREPAAPPAGVLAVEVRD